MGAQKIIIDTNVLISAFGFGGNPRRVLELVLDGRYELLIPEKQLGEIKRVLAYPKLKFNVSQRKQILNILLQVARVVSTSQVLDVSADPDDNMFLEAVKEHNASYIITGDKHLRHLHKFEGARIMDPGAFLMTAAVPLRWNKDIRAILDEVREELKSKFDR